MKRGLVWDDWNTNHIKKHSVQVSEVEEVYHSKHKQKYSYKSRIMILGKTKHNRLLTIVCSVEKQTDYYVVSARDMSKNERRWYYEQR